MVFFSAAGVGVSVGVLIAAASSILSSVAGLITNEKCPKLRKWGKLTILLNEKTKNKCSMDLKNWCKRSRGK